MPDFDELTERIIGTAIKIHRELGPGLFESVYEAVLARALAREGLAVERQRPIGFSYDGMTFDEGFRADLVVENKVLIELKSVAKLAPVHGKQLLTYLRLARLPVGLLLNFGEGTLRDGLRRITNDTAPTDPKR